MRDSEGAIEMAADGDGMLTVALDGSFNVEARHCELGEDVPMRPSKRFGREQLWCWVKRHLNWTNAEVS